MTYMQVSRGLTRAHLAASLVMSSLLEEEETVVYSQ